MAAGLGTMDVGMAMVGRASTARGATRHSQILDEGWEQGVCPSSQSHHLLSILNFFVKVLSTSI